MSGTLCEPFPAVSYVRRIWFHLNSSLWFVPSLLVGAAIALATTMIELDLRYDADLESRFPRLFGAGAEGSRGLLEAIATSMMTITGVTFSITIVALALASTQYTPRILRNFMRNRTNQMTLGVFVGVFVYSLLVLRTIRGDDDGFVPSLSVVVAILLTLVSVWVLILFIHHIATSIEASTLISLAADETISGLRELFAEGADDEDSEQRAPDDYPQGGVWQGIAAQGTGYIQSVDVDLLIDLAESRDLVLRMERSVGEFVVKGTPVLAIHSSEPPRADVCRRVALAYVIGRFRTVDQDPEFGIRQIVDIALKALSPGVNDSTTATNCVDYLGAILVELSRRKLEDDYRTGEDRRLRVIARAATFEDLLGKAFDQIREAAGGNTAVLGRMLMSIECVARFARTGRQRKALDAHVELIAEAAHRTIAAPHSRNRLSELIQQVRKTIQSKGSAPSASRAPA